MNLHKKMMIALLGVAGFGSQAGAVQLAANGLGDVLIFPYFTVTDNFSTELNIMNTEDLTVVLKVRARSAENSRMCWEKTLVLPPYAAWAAVIERNGEQGAQIRTPSNTCAAPTFSQNTSIGSIDAFEHSCQEGFVEVIEMGTGFAGSENNPEHVVSYNAYNMDGAPRDCGLVIERFTEDSIKLVKTQFKEPKNNLRGSFSLLNGQDGLSVGGEAVTLANFFGGTRPPVDGVSGEDLIFSTAAVGRPSLNDAQPKESISYAPLERVGFPIIKESWDAGYQAVSAVLMHAKALDQWATNPNRGANTIWSVTFPTRHFFSANSVGDDFYAGSCSSVRFDVANRNGQQTQVTDDLCFDTNVVDFNSGNVISESKVLLNLDTSTVVQAGTNTPSKNGRATLVMEKNGRKLTGKNTLAPFNDQDHYGLPVIVYSMKTLQTGDASKNYAAMWQNSYVNK